MGYGSFEKESFLHFQINLYQDLSGVIFPDLIFFVELVYVFWISNYDNIPEYSN